LLGATVGALQWQLPLPSQVCPELVQSLHTAPPWPHASSCVFPFVLHVPALQQPSQFVHVALAAQPWLTQP
jgi:hypothetical protein